MALLDADAPSPFEALARAGLRFNSGAGTQQIFRAIAPKLGKESIDREARDQIMLPLREVGVLGSGYANTRTGSVEPNYWKPKSPNKSTSSRTTSRHSWLSAMTPSTIN